MGRIGKVGGCRFDFIESGWRRTLRNATYDCVLKLYDSNYYRYIIKISNLYMLNGKQYICMQRDLIYITLYILKLIES